MACRAVKRLLFLPVLLVAACCMAALYGAVHNQLSYTVAPGYFHEFKFLQFRLPPDAWTRVGASWIGVLASWWMGLILAVPIFCAALFVKGDSAFIRAFLTATIIVLSTTLVIGLGALAMAYMTFTPDNLPWWMDGWDVSNPVAFARAGQMHNFSYLGGLIGTGLGLIWVIQAAWRSRRAA